jgi:16S rRNA (cytosine967-C5)-methyltransferase
VIPDRSRRAAVDVVLAVERDAAYSNLLLPRILRDRGLTGADAAFATELTYGTLRRQGSLDVVLTDGARRDRLRRVGRRTASTDLGSPRHRKGGATPPG